MKQTPEQAVTALQKEVERLTKALLVMERRLRATEAKCAQLKSTVARLTNTTDSLQQAVRNRK